MKLLPPHHPRSRSDHCPKGEFSWHTMLTASPTWKVFRRFSRAGPYPFTLPVFPPANQPVNGETRKTGCVNAAAPPRNDHEPEVWVGSHD